MCLSSVKRCRNVGVNVTYYLYKNCTLDCSDESCDEDATEDGETFDSNMEYDTSNTTFINELWLIAEPSNIIVKTSIFLPIVLWGIFANSLLLYILFKNGHLRSPINLLIGNMAAADLLSLLIYPWTMLVNYFYQNYQFGAIVCRAEGGVECAILITSVASLSVISYDRLTAIVLPQETRLGKRKVKIIMGLTWIIGFIFATPLFVLRSYKERVWLNFVEKYCAEDISITVTYWYIIVTILVWLPLSIMLICYSAILVKLIKYEKSIRRRVRSLNVSYKKKVVKTMFTVVLTFMICRLPFTVCIYYRDYLHQQRLIGNNVQVQNQANGLYLTLWFISKYLIFLNAGINPVVYGSTNEKFQLAFKTTKLHKWLFPLAGKTVTVVVPPKLKKQTKSTEVNSKKSKLMPFNAENKEKTSNDNPTGADSSNVDVYI